MKVAAIREVDLGRVINSQVDVSLPWGTLLEQIVEAARKAIADDMWRWFRENQNVSIFTVKKWIFSWTIKVKDVRFLFELLFGPEVF
jgi:hypothetical protein